jgi:hypothetical protein
VSYRVAGAQGRPIRVSKNSARKSSTEGTNQKRIQGSSLDLLISPQQFDFLLPFACKWAEAQQERILRDGQPVSHAQMAAGISFQFATQSASYLPQIAPPDYPLPRAAADATQLISPAVGPTGRPYAASAPGTGSSAGFNPVSSTGAGGSAAGTPLGIANLATFPSASIRILMAIRGFSLSSLSAFRAILSSFSILSALAISCASGVLLMMRAIRNAVSWLCVS